MFIGIVRLFWATRSGDRNPNPWDVVMFAGLASIAQCNVALSRWPRLGYESLRPMTRQRWVIENAMAIAFNITFLQLIVIGFNPLVLMTLLKGNVSLPWILTVSLIFLSGQILFFGLFSWTASFESGSLGSILAAGAGAAALSLTAEVFNSTSAPDLPMTLVVSGFTSIIGLALCWMAYRRWCRIDLA